VKEAGPPPRRLSNRQPAHCRRSSGKRSYGAIERVVAIEKLTQDFASSFKDPRRRSTITRDLHTNPPSRTGIRTADRCEVQAHQPKGFRDRRAKLCFPLKVASQSDIPPPPSTFTRRLQRQLVGAAERERAPAASEKSWRGLVKALGTGSRPNVHDGSEHLAPSPYPRHPSSQEHARHNSSAWLQKCGSPDSSSARVHSAGLELLLHLMGNRKNPINCSLQDRIEVSHQKLSSGVGKN